MSRHRAAALLAGPALLASLLLVGVAAPVSAAIVCTVSAPAGGVLNLDSLGSGQVACGGPGDDYIRRLGGGATFYGGGGNDSVNDTDTGSTFYGEGGNDRILNDNFGTFYGGGGSDNVYYMASGTSAFYGGGGSDRLTILNWGLFDGGGGSDTACYVNADPAYGMVRSVESIGC